MAVRQSDSDNRWRDRGDPALQDSRLQSKRIVIRLLKRDDIDKRLKWKKYRDPLYGHYNLGKLTGAQKRQWYLKRKHKPQTHYLAITTIRGKLLGFLNLYEVDEVKKKSKLGIYLGSEYLDKGYGTESILILLRFYFEELRFRDLRLDVASHNHRAIKCYKKCGFEFVRYYFTRHDPRNRLNIFGDPQFKKFRKFFKKEGDKILVQFEEMRITRKTWERQAGPSYIKESSPLPDRGRGPASRR